MKVCIRCSENIKGILLEMLNARFIETDEDSSICIAEKGFELPENKLYIVFDLNCLNSLKELLDRILTMPDEPDIGNSKKTVEKKHDTIIGRSDEERYEIFPYDRILYFESRGNYVFLASAEGEFRVKEKLYELEKLLPDNRFIRVNKSFIVNITSIKEIIPWFGQRLVLRFTGSKKEIEVSKNYVMPFKSFLGM